jgi:hypothetical protein
MLSSPRSTTIAMSVFAFAILGSIAGTPHIATPKVFGWVASNHGISSSFGLLGAVLAVTLVLAFSLSRLRLIPQPQETN